MKIARLPCAYLSDSLIFSHSHSSLVLPAEIEVQCDLTCTSKKDRSHRNAEAHHVFPVLRGTENLTDLMNDCQQLDSIRHTIQTYNHASGVSDTLVHTYRHGSLVVWRMAVEQPRYVEADDNVHAGRHTKGGEI